MIDYEKELAELIAKDYDEEEYDFPYYDRRSFVSLNGVLTSQGEETDILSITYTINEEKNTEYIQLFISSEDDMAQDFISLQDLTDEERERVIPMIKEQLTI